MHIESVTRIAKIASAIGAKSAIVCNADLTTSDSAFTIKERGEIMDTIKIAKKLAELFDCPCNFSPLDEEMQAYCMEHHYDPARDECCPIFDGYENVVCWCRVLEKWEKENDK